VVQAAQSVPIQKQIVLLGAGNAHLRFVKMFGMRPIQGVAVTLVSEGSVIPYSAMVPGHIAGDYTFDDITIDLVRLCRAARVRFLSDRGVSVDAQRRRVAFASRPELDYDVLSLGVGSLPVCPAGVARSPMSWLMRPLGGLLQNVNWLEKELKRAPRPCRFVIVGGGASGCELALAIARRFRLCADFHVTLLQGNTRLLPQFPDKAARLFQAAFTERSIDVRLDVRVTGGDDKSLELNGHEKLPYDVVLWATNAAPHEILRTSHLPLTADGFLRVHDTLQSVGDPSVFGTGDCIAIEQHPDVPKNGVLAVREGGVLFDNIGRFLRGQALSRFRPQRICLCLMNTSDGTAMLNYGPFVSKGRLARHLKDRIDRAWIDKFTRFPPMSGAADDEENVAMRCGGCGSKISSDVLSAVLKRIDPGDDPRILLGTRAGEDASVHRMRPESFGGDPAKLVEVQTIDFFKAFVDDPYLFGRIAALHAVSDLHAMNARPFIALAVATLPYARGPVLETMLFELLSGAVHSLRQMGVTLTGGHTTEGSEMALGFSVTGYADEDRLFRKSALQPGDLLILTKPVGSGAILAAWMRGECRAAWYDKLIDGMLTANARAAEVFQRQGVRACTDITGFGLAGHLFEMLDASHVSARLQAGLVPLYEGFNEVVEHGIVSTLQRDNAKVGRRIENSAASAWLFDPQTSGGLLAGVKPEIADETLRLLKETGYPQAAIIGEVLTGTPSIELAAARSTTPASKSTLPGT